MAGNINERLLKDLKNTFTYEFWVEPQNNHRIEEQSRNKPSRESGQNFIIGPGEVEESDEAVISISVGFNGVTVYEQTKKDRYAVLVYETNISETIHIAVVYEDKWPFLFINGTFIKKGKRSSKKHVYPSGIIFGQPGLFFTGDINEIRIWDYSRTNGYSNNELDGIQEGLYGIWPAQNFEEVNATKTIFTLENEETSKNQSINTDKTQDIKTNQVEEKLDINKNQNIEVSIIIPSFNKFPLNLFTLYSLENQSFDLKKMEVIIIDDASTDQTEEELTSYNPPWRFTYIRCKKNLGRSRVRNLGIKAAKGNILIFLDAEMITGPNFVENHYKFHQTKDKVILSGAMYSKAIYSCIFPEFDTEKINKIAEITNNNQELYKRFQAYKQPSKVPYPLIEKKDINSKTIEDLVITTYPWFQSITSNFEADLTGFQFPWMALLTGNVSLRKELIEQAGLFDEEFIRYGYEDWELGYRLYKMGAEYIVRDDLVTYHQEHPVGDRKWNEAMGNLGLFTEKHDDVDILILGIELADLADLLTMNNILREYKLLEQAYPEQFQAFQDKFIAILETIVMLLNVDVRHFNILGAAGFGSDERNELIADIENLENLKKFPNLTELLKKIVRS